MRVLKLSCDVTVEYERFALVLETRQGEHRGGGGVATACLCCALSLIKRHV